MKGNLSRALLTLLFLPALAWGQAPPIAKDEATAAQRRIPIYLVDVTDDETPETGLTISGAECEISKNGGSWGTCAGSIGEVDDGVYYYEATTGEVDTVGYVTLKIAEAAANAFLINAPITQFDFSSTAPNANCASASNDAFEAADFAADGTAQAGASSTITLAAAESYADDVLIGRVICIVAATGKGQCRYISDNVGSTDVVTVGENWTTTPDSTSKYVIGGLNKVGDVSTAAKTGYSLAGSQTFNVTGNITGNLSGSVGSVTGAVGSVTGAVGSVTGNVGGNLTGSIGSLSSTAKSEVNAEMVDALATDTYGELTSCPTATAPITTMIRYIFMVSRNKITQTATVQTIERDDGSTDLCTNSVSDDGTTFTRGEFN